MPFCFIVNGEMSFRSITRQNPPLELELYLHAYAEFGNVRIVELGETPQCIDTEYLEYVLDTDTALGIRTRKRAKRSRKFRFYTVLVAEPAHYGFTCHDLAQFQAFEQRHFVQEESVEVMRHAKTHILVTDKLIVVHQIECIIVIGISLVAFVQL